MLKEFEKAVREFQTALAEAGITGNVDVTLPREPMLKLYTEWLEAPVMRFGPHYGFERSVFEFPGAGGTWTIRHERPTPGKIAEPPALFCAERLIADEHWKRGHDSGKKTGMDIAAERLGPLLWPAWESMTPRPDPEAVLNAVEIRLKALRTPLDAIQAEARDAANQHTAAILATMLGMKSPPADGWDLSKALSRTKEALDSSTKLRNAALEEAAQHEDEHRPNCGHCIGCRAGNSIRALKSKSAPDSRPKQVDYCPECEKLKTAHGMSCSQDVKPEPSGYHGECHSQPIVHDFGWALAQMRAGKKVRRSCWVNGSWLRYNGYIVSDRESLPEVKTDHIVATDWEVAP